MWLPVAIGYSFAVLAGAVLIGQIVDALWRSIGWQGPEDRDFRLNRWIPELVGAIERALYILSLQLDFSEFIGFWLALKVAGQWKLWSEKTSVGTRTIHGRAVYQVFLIGNALSVVYGAAGFLILGWVQTSEHIVAMEAAIAVIGCSLGILVWVRLKGRTTLDAT